MWFVVAFGVLGTLVINEVLYDPPGSDSGREFVEILNVGREEFNLADVVLEAADGASIGSWRLVWQGSPQVVAPGRFFVIAGDSLPMRHARLARSLQNGPDALRLRHSETVLDRLGYGELTDPELYEGHPASDVRGRSLARIPDGMDTEDNAADFQAADPTPNGNNAALRNWRVSILIPEPTRLWPHRRLRASVQIDNTGLQAIEAGSWKLRVQAHAVIGEPYRDPLQRSAPQRIEVQSPDVRLEAGESQLVDVSWSGELGLHLLRVEARGVDEDSLDNDAESYARIGAGPVLVNEIMFAPHTHAPEWVELWNRDQRAHNLSDWTLTDASGTVARLVSSEPLAPERYAVVSADSSADLDGLVTEGLRVAAVPWPSLNNVDGDAGYADILVLRDPAGIIQDALFYRSAQASVRGRSLERLTPDPDARGLLWTASKDPTGATPGRKNSAVGPPATDSRLTLHPNPFSPDGDGVDDLLTVALELPQGAEGFRASIFDGSGRRRLELAADRLGAGPRHLVWDGRDKDQVDCPTGLYIFHFEWFGSFGKQRRLQAVGLVRR